MVKIETTHRITIGENAPIEMSESDAQDLCAVLLAKLAHTLDPPAVPLSTEEPPPFIPSSAKINEEPGP